MPSKEPKKITCQHCSTLFGIEVDGVLSIKNRDLYRSFEGGTVSGPCRGCGTLVVWPEEKKNDR